MAGNIENMRPPKTKDEAKRRRATGGLKSGEVRRAKRDAKETALLFLNMAATGNLDEILDKLNIEKNDRTNLMGIVARHVVSAQSGNVNSARLVLEMAGMLQKNGSENSVNVNIGTGDDESVIICLPAKDED